MSFHMGIFGFGPNSAAALLDGGRIVAFAEEERFNRIKQSPFGLPIASMLYCLGEARVSLDEIGKIGFGWDAPGYVARMPNFYRDLHKKLSTVPDEYNFKLESALLWTYDPIRIRTELAQSLALRGHRFDPKNVEFFSHHKCHAASAFFASGFEEAAILTIDGSGEEVTTAIWRGTPTGLELMRSFELPNSLGGVYATFTEFLGFKAYEEEGKLMGLAPYGNSRADLDRKLDSVFGIKGADGDYFVNPFMRYIGKRTYGRRFTDALVELFGRPRISSEPITDEHRDIAFAVQKRLEEIVCRLADDALARAGTRNLCLAGGVAMNCKMNGKIANIKSVERIFVQPASSDNGVALGAAYLLAAESGVRDFEPMTHAYLGPSHSNEAILGALKEAKVAYRRSEDVAGEVARILYDGKIVAWFQGRMEVGARALGCRSILANPMFPEMRKKINLEVKHREEWRPFCPSLAAESFGQYFDTKHDSDYMIMAFQMRDFAQKMFPSVVHVDGSARPQTVRKASNPRFHDLLTKFGALAGHPVLLNSSFNIQGEPIVSTPQQALRCFGGTGIDVLAMGDYIVEKSRRD
jgi:carbamoyltransferase